MQIALRTFWYETKTSIIDTLGVTTDEAHLHAGLALFLISAVALRRLRYGVAYAWLLVFLLQAANEILDARDWIMWTGTVNWQEMAKDFAKTLFWPSILGLIWAKASLRPAE